MRRNFMFILILLLNAACSTSNASSSTELPPGDPTRGSALYTESVNGAPACATCHTLDGSTLVGPSMQGFSQRAPTRVEGQSAQEYTRNSILQPASHIVSGFSNLMYIQYAQHLSPQQIADLIAYLLTI